MTVRKVMASLLCALAIAGCSSSQKADDQDDDASLAESESDEGEEGLDPDLAEDELGVEGESGIAGSVEITDLRYASQRSGGTIVIRTNTRATYRLREVPDQKQIVIEIANASLPDRLKRPYITREFNQSISAINAYQDRGSTTARFVVQMRDDDRLRVEQRGNEIFLAPERMAGADSIALTADEVDRAAQDGKTSGSAPRDGLPLSGVNLDDFNSTTMRFYGKPISLEVRATEVRDVINFISEQSGANLVVSEEVRGQITLKLKQIPWDQALLLVMKTRQLGYVRQGNVLRIAPLEILQVENENARRVIEAQRAAEPLRVRIVPVSYSDVAKLSTQVEKFLSARGKVVPDVRTSSIVITDIVENIERATNLIKALDVPPLQVQIEAKVIEAGDNFQRSIGVNWGFTGQSTELGGDISLTPTNRVSLGGRAGSQFTGMSSGVTVGTIDALGVLDATLQLAEINNEIKVISSPRVVTMNNETANIAQITTIPYPVVVTAANGTTTTTTQTFDVKLALDVTPQITSESDVIMAVTIKREFAGDPPRGMDRPIVNARDAKTKVMVQSGQTAVIGGIYQSDTSLTETGIPGLSKLPLLGWLFRERRTSNQKNELLLFLTPRILNAAEGSVKSGEL